MRCRAARLRTERPFCMGRTTRPGASMHPVDPGQGFTPTGTYSTRETLRPPGMLARLVGLAFGCATKCCCRIEYLQSDAIFYSSQVGDGSRSTRPRLIASANARVVVRKDFAMHARRLLVGRLLTSEAFVQSSDVKYRVPTFRAGDSSSPTAKSDCEC